MRIKLVIYKNYTEMHGQQNIKLYYNIIMLDKVQYNLLVTNEPLSQSFRELTFWPTGM
jgi:hypothetical protein